MTDDGNPIEERARQFAGQCAGQYIDDLKIESLPRFAEARADNWLKDMKVTDMANWSEAQWIEFIRVICSGYVTEVVRLRMYAADAIEKVRT